MPAAYYLVGNGLGNIIQTTPAFVSLQVDRDEVTILCHEKDKAFAEIVYKGVANVVTKKQNLECDVFKSCSPIAFKKDGNISEVDLNLKLVGCDPIHYNQFKHQSFCGYQAVDDSYDVVICNGYNKRLNQTDWQVKSYVYWIEVVAKLVASGLRVASVGLESEYVFGTENRTGMGLAKTLGLIRNSRVLACNDTGFYHAASAWGMPCVVVFTMTDKTKNYDPVFHRSAVIASLNLPCQPCQLNERGFWIKNQPICQWACRFVPVDDVVNKIKEFL